MIKKISALGAAGIVFILLNCSPAGDSLLTMRYYSASSRVFDLKTRGKNVEDISRDLDDCRNLLLEKKNKKAKSLLQDLIARINKAYLETFPDSYNYNEVEFNDIYLNTSLGNVIGYIAYPEKEGVFPGIVILRGAGGSSVDMKRHGYHYARQGYVCLIPEFNSEFSLKGVVDIKKWLAVFQNHPRYDNNSLGILSFSRGGWFVLKLIQQNVIFHAWINYFGVLFSDMFDPAAVINNPVPVLILHGKKDKTCPVQWAYDLERIYRNNGFPYEMHIFENEGHGFSRDVFQKTQELSEAFLEKYLKKR